MNYKYTDLTNRVVADDNGWSGLVTSPEVQAWLAAGNTPEPADPAENMRIAEIKAELDALDFKKIRPIAAGDAEYLSILQAQTVVLRDELKLLLYPVVSQSQEPDQQNGPTEIQ